MSKVFVSYLPGVLPVLEIASNKALLSAANVGRNQLIKNLTAAGGPRTGRTYRVPRTSRFYTASAPGEFPSHERLGDLRGSYRVKPGKGAAYVGSNLEYALPLEKKPSDKGGREHLRPSLEQARPAMILELGKRWF